MSHWKYPHVGTLLDKARLVIQGVESAGAYICTYGITDGIERACIDHLDPKVVIEPK